MSEATARAARKTINPEFQVHRLNPAGLTKAEEVAIAFDELLEQVKNWIPESRELSLVKTHMEQACFYVKKGLAKQAANQQQ